MHQTNAVLVGPSMSCAAVKGMLAVAHVQTHFIVATGLAVRRLILTRWKPPAGDEAGDLVGISDSVVSFVEVGLSSQAVEEGMSIADLYADQTLCETSTHQSWIGTNPSVMAVDPYSLVFVKQGGSLLAWYKEYASSGHNFGSCKRLLLQVADSYHRACLAHADSALLSALDQLAAVPKCCGGAPGKFVLDAKTRKPPDRLCAPLIEVALNARRCVRLHARGAQTRASHGQYRGHVPQVALRSCPSRPGKTNMPPSRAFEGSQRWIHLVHGAAQRTRRTRWRRAAGCAPARAECESSGTVTPHHYKSFDIHFLITLLYYSYAYKRYVWL